MNAKFEKWFANKYPEEFSSAKDGYLGGQRCMDYASSGYNEALQSLEVTPELVDAAKEGLFGSSYYDLGYQGYIGDAAIHEALTAVFDAIKEQAK